MSVVKAASARGLRNLPRNQLRTLSLTQYRQQPNNEDDVEKRSFKGQLYDSTAARTQRERQERQRFSRERGEASGGRNSAITFGADFW